MKVVITDADYPDIEIEQAVLAAAGCTVVRADAREPDQVAKVASGAGALIYQWATITGEVLDAAPSVGLVVRYGVGVDSVDLVGAERRGVWVANVPGYGTEEVAAHAFAGAMACLRHLGPYDRLARSGRWDYLATGTVRRLSTLTFGCLGLGRIGRMIAERAAPWFGRVIAHDPGPDGPAWPGGVGRVGLDELFASADVVSLHLPLTEDTRHVVDARRLALMPPGAVLVNTARGGLVDERALLAALDEQRLSAAALDTWADEPVPPGHPLVDHPSVLATPHAAWYSREAEEEVRRRAAENVAAWVRTGRPDHPVVVGTRTAPHSPAARADTPGATAPGGPARNGTGP